MAIEIERKFLLKNDDWKSETLEGMRISQGYLNTQPERTVRVRVIGDNAFLTIKGKTQGTVRQEYEYAIPVEDGEQLLMLCERPLIEKVRYRIPVAAHTWEIDEFQGENEGLVIAEVELAEEGEEVTLPGWVGEEVSHDARYFNAALIKDPYTKWRR